MHYNIVFEVEKNNFFVKKIIHYRDADDARIPKVVRITKYSH